MTEETEKVQFSLLKLLLWTAAVAQLLGILAILRTGLTVTVYVVSWFVVVGILRIVVTSKAATVASATLGIIAATACFFFIIEEHAQRVFALVGGLFFGPVLGLLMSVLVEIALHTAEAIDKLAKRAGNRHEGRRD